MDVIALLGGGIAVAFGAFGAIRNEGAIARAGALFSAAVACVGLSYFGWKPFFGGSHEPGTYFGCMMLTFGIYAWLRFFTPRS